MATLTSDLLNPVNSAHRFDEAALLRSAAANVEGFPPPPVDLTVLQFGHGQSNPTFCFKAVSRVSPGVVKRYVLRKKPPGILLESAHAVEREFQVLKALGVHTDVPVPKVFCLCTDTSIIGTSFYIMEYLEGRIFLDNKLPGIVPERRKAIYQETAKALASLHKVNVDFIGLQKFGRRENYCKRQVRSFGYFKWLNYGIMILPVLLFMYKDASKFSGGHLTKKNLFINEFMLSVWNQEPLPGLIVKTGLLFS